MAGVQLPVQNRYLTLITDSKNELGLKYLETNDDLNDEYDIEQMQKELERQRKELEEKKRELEEHKRFEE
jgi:hypothetical protein